MSEPSAIMTRLWDAVKNAPILAGDERPESDHEPVLTSAGGGKRGSTSDAAQTGDMDRALAAEPLNDTGNSRRLLARFGDRFMFVREVGPYVWTGTHWDGEGGAEHAKRLGQQTSEAMAGEAAVLRSAGPHKGETEASWERRVARHYAFGVTSGNAGRITAMIDLAAAHCTVAPEDLDANPLALNIENGTLRFLVTPDGSGKVADIRLTPHRRDDLISKCMPVHYDPQASCSQFLAFLERVVPDPAVRDFLQVWLGYCLTGYTTEQKLVFLYGSGANGKSTLVDLIARMMDGYSASLRFESLAGDNQRRGDAATPDLARLPGVRFLRAAEPEQGMRFKEAEVKAITGGEPLLVRHLQARFFEMRPVFKLVLSGNHRPDIRGLDEGIWRRILLVPFDVIVPREERDPSLPDKLWAERAGILNWMVEGLRIWLEQGLIVPDAVMAATESYRADSDPVGEWIRDCTGPDPGGSVTAREAYDSFKAWCEDNAVREWSEKAFAAAMTNKGVPKDKGRIRQYRDIRLVAASPQPHAAADEIY